MRDEPVRLLAVEPVPAGGIRALRTTVDARFWVVAMISTLAAIAVLGVPTAVIPNPFFVRMTPTDPLTFWSGWRRHR
jgi:hypothetical protein